MRKFIGKFLAAGLCVAMADHCQEETQGCCSYNVR